MAKLRIWATPRVACQTPWCLRRQLRRMFHDFMCARACSTRARTLLWTVLRSSFHCGSGGCPLRGLRYGMITAGLPW
jgi:hypothetical protein